MSLDNFDLNTASIRSSDRNQQQYLEALATKLQLSLPQQTSIKRAFRLFTKHKPIQTIMVSFANHDFIINCNNQHNMNASIAKKSKGIRLKTEEVNLNTWLMQLNEAIQSLSSDSKQSNNLLSEFLE